MKDLNEFGKVTKHVIPFLDDIVGAIAASASTRVAQISNEDLAELDDEGHNLFRLSGE